LRNRSGAVAPLLTFAAALNSDIETKQALRLLAKDELSSATWLRDYAVMRDPRSLTPHTRIAD